MLCFWVWRMKWTDKRLLADRYCRWKNPHKAIKTLDCNERWKIYKKLNLYTIG
jgi:hypothetical protein